MSIRIRRFTQVLAALLLFLAPLTALAEEVRTVSPSWQGFTSPEGQGLYHDLVRAVFEPLGMTVTHLEVPAKRGLVMVREGQADMYMCKPEAAPGLRLSSTPMYEGEFHALFKSAAFPQWDGARSMTDKRVVWRLGYYTSHEFPVRIDHSETLTGDEALSRVVRGGSDFYIDDKNLIMESIQRSPIPVDSQEYRIEPVGFRQYFPVFATTQRGDELRQAFEQGMRRLAGEGRLQPIYDKWKLPMPRTYK